MRRASAAQSSLASPAVVLKRVMYTGLVRGATSSLLAAKQVGLGANHAAALPSLCMPIHLPSRSHVFLFVAVYFAHQRCDARAREWRGKEEREQAAGHYRYRGMRVHKLYPSVCFTRQGVALK